MPSRYADNKYRRGFYSNDTDSWMKSKQLADYLGISHSELISMIIRDYVKKNAKNLIKCAPLTSWYEEK